MPRALPLFALCGLILCGMLPAHAGSGDTWQDIDPASKAPPTGDDSAAQATPPDDLDMESSQAGPPLDDDPDAGSTLDVREPYWGIEIRLTPYKPLLSDNTKVDQVYDLIYQQGSGGIIKNHPLMLGLDFDWYPLESFELNSPIPGILGVYARLAYWTVSGPTRRCTDDNTSGGKTIRCSTDTVLAGQSFEGNDTGSFNVAPVGIGVVYRLDSIRKNTGFPLLFNFKAGFDYYIWWADSGAGSSHYTDPKTGSVSIARGGTLGFSVAAGMSIGLDAFGGKPSGTRQSTRSAIFAEYQLQDGHFAGKNIGERLDFTDHLMITVGLELEFL